MTTLIVQQVILAFRCQTQHLRLRKEHLLFSELSGGCLRCPCIAFLMRLLSFLLKASFDVPVLWSSHLFTLVERVRFSSRLFAAWLFLFRIPRSSSRAIILVSLYLRFWFSNSIFLSATPYNCLFSIESLLFSLIFLLTFILFKLIHTIISFRI